MEKPKKIRRFPLWVTRGAGLAMTGGSLCLLLSGLWYMAHYPWGFGQLWFVLTALILLFLGLGLLFAKKGLPLTWKDWAAACEAAREEPDALSEAFSPEERLEHLKILRDQGVLSEEEYREKRKELQDRQ